MCHNSLITCASTSNNNKNNRPYLSAARRDALADYALPTAVILMSLVGSTIFDNIYGECWRSSFAVGISIDLLAPPKDTINCYEVFEARA